MRIARIVLGYLVSLTTFLVLLPAFVITLGYWAESSLHLWHPRRLQFIAEINASLPALIVAAALAAWGWFWVVWAWWFLLTRGRGHPTEAFGIEVTPVTQQLVSAGPYAYTRNPMVFGYFCVLLAIAGFFGSIGMLVPIAVIAAIGWAQIVYFEEPRLEHRFGAAYREYKQRVPRFAPRLSARGAQE